MALEIARRLVGGAWRTGSVDEGGGGGGGGSQPSGMLTPVAAVEPASSVELTGEQTIDGVELVAGDRALLTQQSDATENGIWTVQSGAWTRPDDFSDGASIASGICVFVQKNSGALQGGLLISLTGPEGGGDPAAIAPFVVGTDAISFNVVADALAFGFRGADGNPAPASTFNFNGIGLVAPWLGQSDPHNAGTLWNDGGSPAISEG